jgi:hypothetical protein
VSGYHLMPSLIAAVRDELPGIRVVLKELVSLQQVKALEPREIDLGNMRAQFFMHGIARALADRDTGCTSAREASRDRRRRISQVSPSSCTPRWREVLSRP